MGGFQDLVTISTSEPLLAEAASLGMNTVEWAASTALLEHLECSYLYVDEQGEPIASLILLLARDNALKAARPLPRSIRLDSDGQQRVVPVVDFLHSLLNDSSSQWQNLLPTHFRTKKDKTRTLGQAFKEASVWFNHFIKVQDFAVIGEDYLWHFIVRGAAVLCAKGHSGVDIVVPVLLKNKLMKSNVTAMLIQIKNDPKYTDSVDGLLFETMDPFDVGLFSKKGNPRLPIIRMVFALASSVPSVVYPQPQSAAGNDKFTCYDIWCAGVTDTTFKVIDRTEIDTYKALVLQSQVVSEPHED